MGPLPVSWNNNKRSHSQDGLDLFMLTSRTGVKVRLAGVFCFRPWCSKHCMPSRSAFQACHHLVLVIQKLGSYFLHKSDSPHDVLPWSWLSHCHNAPGQKRCGFWCFLRFLFSLSRCPNCFNLLSRSSQGQFLNVHLHKNLSACVKLLLGEVSCCTASAGSIFGEQKLILT